MSFSFWASIFLLSFPVCFHCAVTHNKRRLTRDIEQATLNIHFNDISLTSNEIHRGYDSGRKSDDLEEANVPTFKVPETYLEFRRNLSPTQTHQQPPNDIISTTPEVTTSQHGQDIDVSKYKLKDEFFPENDRDAVPAFGSHETSIKTPKEDPPSKELSEANKEEHLENKTKTPKDIDVSKYKLKDEFFPENDRDAEPAFRYLGTTTKTSTENPLNKELKGTNKVDNFENKSKTPKKAPKIFITNDSVTNQNFTLKLGKVIQKIFKREVEQKKVVDDETINKTVGEMIDQRRKMIGNRKTQNGNEQKKTRKAIEDPGTRQSKSLSSFERTLQVLQDKLNEVIKMLSEMFKQTPDHNNIYRKLNGVGAGIKNGILSFWAMIKSIVSGEADIPTLISSWLQGSNSRRSLRDQNNVEVTNDDVLEMKSAEKKEVDPPIEALKQDVR